MFKGLYIEDEIDNAIITTKMFKINGLDIEHIEALPADLSEYYRYILENNIDFLLIDNHLEKQVTYYGIDVLREIRKNDSTIYAVLLTNYQLEEFKEEFSEYDYEINKSELRDRIGEITKKINRACSLRADNELVGIMEKSNDENEDVIRMLRELSDKIDTLKC